MKAVVSIPDPVFAAAEELAARLGVSRSRLYARALSAYLERHLDQRITERLDEVYAEGSSIRLLPGCSRPRFPATNRERRFSGPGKA